MLRGRPIKGDSESSLSVVHLRELAKAAEVSTRTIRRHSAIERKSPALLAMAERGEVGLLTAERASRVVSGEVLARATPAEVKAFADTLNERLDARLGRLVKAGVDLRKEPDVVRQLEPNEQINAALAEVRWLLRPVMGGAL